MIPAGEQLALIREALAQAGTQRRGIAYRFTEPEYAGAPQVVAGMGGSCRDGGRYNPPGIPTVYLCEDASTAVQEVRYGTSHNGAFEGEPAESRVIVAVRFVLRRVGVLDGAFLKAAGLSLQDLLIPHWRLEAKRHSTTLTWEIGKLAIELGYEGLIVPSRYGEGVYNLVVYPVQLDANSLLLPSTVHRNPADA